MAKKLTHQQVVEVVKLHRKHSVKSDNNGNIKFCGWCGAYGGKHKPGCKLGH